MSADTAGPFFFERNAGWKQWAVGTGIFIFLKMEESQTGRGCHMKGNALSLVFALIQLFGGASAASADNANLIVGDHNTVVFVDVTREFE
jgi:hypothetical protein